MCNVCWESYYAGYIKKSEVYQCIYYLDIFRNQRDAYTRPKRDPDDPYYCLQYGEGLLPWMFTKEEEEFYFDEIYRRIRRARIYRLKAAGKGADAPEERAARGVEDETKWVAETSLNDFMEK